LQWARENGCPCPDLNDIYVFAAISGKADMVTWFCEQGFPLHDGLCTSAAGFGHLELLIWLREQGCPLDLEDCSFLASSGGRNEVVDWLGQFTDETWHTIAN